MSRHARHRVSPTASPMIGSGGQYAETSKLNTIGTDYWIIRFRG
jgi:hypothetical protein